MNFFTLCEDKNVKCLKGSGENKTRTEKKHTYTIYMLLSLVYTVVGCEVSTTEYKIDYVYFITYTLKILLKFCMPSTMSRIL